MAKEYSLDDLWQDPGFMGELDVEKIEQKYAEIDDQLIALNELVKKYQSEALGAKERGDAETLSNTLVRLARVNAALGGKASYAMYVARNAERVYRRTREQTKLDAIAEKNAIGKADSMAYVDDEVEKTFKLYSDTQLLADKASDMSYRTDTFLKMAQSGLSLIKQDINGGRP
jgi:hypothetical protein